VRTRKGSIGDRRKKFDVIVANIDLKSLRRMRKPLLSHLKKRGFLILSGILEQDKERIRRHYLETGFLHSVKITQQGEWVCLTFEKK
jgi:ribosomal protein L11 methylase PrmA